MRSRSALGSCRILGGRQQVPDAPYLGGVQHLGNALSVGGRTRSLISYVRSAQWLRLGAARVVGEVGAAQGIC